LNEKVVLRIQPWRVHRALEVEGQPLLDAGHSCTLRQIEKQGGIQHDRGREDAVAAQEVHLQLHRISKPTEDVNVVPPLFVFAARRVVIDADDVTQLLVQVRVEIRLKNIVQY